MAKISACIFDLDGVVVDTAKYHYLAWKRLANELGFDFTPHDNERLKGVSRMDSLNILLEIGGLSFSNEEKLAFAEKKNHWYTQYIDTMTPDEVLPGVIDFFKLLKANHIKMALGSASKNAGYILEKTQLTSWFDVVIDGTKTSKAKPDPEVFLLGAKGLNKLPHECVVFEDAEAGVEAALNAGMRCVGIGAPEVLGKATFVIPGLYDMTLEKMNL
jgi:beta-phosphoglucomutase